MWAFERTLAGRNPTSSVWGRRFEGLEKLFFFDFKLHANQLQLDTMEEDITASLKILNTVCFEWTTNILNPKENYCQQLQREASTNDAAIKYSIFQAQAQKLCNKRRKQTFPVTLRKLQTAGVLDSPLEGVNLCSSKESWNVLQEESKKAMTPGQRW